MGCSMHPNCARNCATRNREIISRYSARTCASGWIDEGSWKKNGTSRALFSFDLVCGLHYGAKYWSTSPGPAELFDLHDFAFVASSRLLCSIDYRAAVSNRTTTVDASRVNPKSGLEQTRSRSRRKAGFPTSVVCTLRRALLSC